MNDPDVFKVSAGSVTRTAAKGALAVAAMFLVFGVGLLAAVLNEMSPSEGGLMIAIMVFGAIWVVACLVIIVVYVRVLNRKPGDGDIVKVTAVTASFDERLRKIEALRQDGLINEKEYQEKREAILSERW